MSPFLPVGLRPIMLCACWICLSTDVGAQDAAPSTKNLEELIRDLGSRRFKVRQAAEQELATLDEADAGLRQALHSPDLDVARRAGRILDEIDHRRRRVSLSQLLSFRDNGEIDRLAAGIVHWRRGEDDDCWQTATSFAARLVKEAKRAKARTSFPASLFAPIGDFSRYKETHSAIKRNTGKANALEEGSFLIRGDEIVLKHGAGSSIIVSSGTVGSNDVYRDLVLAGGSIRVEDAVHSVIVCDGDFQCDSQITNCIIIARGTVKAAWIVKSFIITSDVVLTLDNSLPPEWRRNKNNIIKENDSTLGGLVKFFETSHVGISVEPAEQGVRVVKLTENKSFAQGGLRNGDILLALDEVPIRSPDSFRRLLRGKLAQANPLAFKVRRSEKVLTIRVHCKD